MSESFDPKAPPSIGSQVRINRGQFEGYAGKVTGLDEQGRSIYFTITVFERPVELSLDYDTAAENLDVVTGSNAKQSAPADRPPD